MATTATKPVEKPIPQQTANDILVLDQTTENAIAKAEGLASAYLERIDDATLGRVRKTFLTARAIDGMKKLFDDKVMDMLLPIAGTPMGFLCDRPSKNDPSPYSREQIRDIVIEALLKGFYPFDNEFNIISNRFYGAKNGWKRKCKDEINGISDLRVVPGIPRQDNGQTVCRVLGQWRQNGVAHQLTGTDGKPGRVFAIKVNTGMGADGIMGKAEAKGYRAIYELGTGTTLSDEDEWTVDAQPTTPADPPVGRQQLGKPAASVAGEIPMEQAVITREQRERIGKLFVEHAKTWVAFQSAFGGLLSLDKLPAEEYDRAVAWLESV